MHTVRFIGRGRAGGSMASALRDAGWTVLEPLGRGDDISSAASGVDVVVISTPDDLIGSIAGSLIPNPDAVVVHMSGSLGLDVLSPHQRRASCHPLVPLPNPDVGTRRLRSGCTFAVSGDPIARDIVDSLGGRAIVVGDEDRATYHAAACIAANHVVALMGQVERIANSIGLSIDDFLGLATAAIKDVERLGPVAALTGPAARGDRQTLTRHRAAIAPEERPGYDAGVQLVSQLVAGSHQELAGGIRVPIYSIEDYLTKSPETGPVVAASAGS